jgi:hypothetical protein
MFRTFAVPVMIADESTSRQPANAFHSVKVVVRPVCRAARIRVDAKMVAKPA